LRRLAVSRYRVADGAAGEEFVMRALDLAQKAHLRPETIADLWLIRGLMADIRGDVPESRRCALVALATFEQVQPPGIPLVSALLNVANIEYAAGEIAAGVAHAERALAIAETLDTTAGA